MLVIKRIGSHPDYWVTTEGEVWSAKKGRALTVLKPQWRSGGYIAARLYTSNKGSSQSVHRLVALAFIPNPENKPQVNHIDGNKTNNKISNLEWSTASENTKHAFRTGLKDLEWNKGVRNNNAKLTADYVRWIRLLYKANEFPQHKLGTMFGISQATVHSVISRQIWKHVD